MQVELVAATALRAPVAEGVTHGAQGAVIPAAIAADEELTRLFEAAVEEAEFVRGELLQALEEAMAGEPNALLRRKRSREAADALVPAAAATELVATGTYRAWREFIAAHNGRFQHEEIRQLALAVLEVMHREAPLLFGDLAEGERR